MDGHSRPCVTERDFVMHLIILGAAFLFKVAAYLDRLLFRCSLARAVPDLDQLLADPAGTLARQDIVIAPARRYFTAFLAAALFGLLGGGIVLVLVVGWLLWLFEVLAPQANPGPALRWGILVYLAVVPPWSLWRCLRAFRAGPLVLRSGGVELRHGEVSVSCPWAVFNATGDVILSNDREHALIPVSPAALHLIEVQTGAAPSVRGRPQRDRPLLLADNRRAWIEDRYAVECLEVGKLLLYLGLSLGSSPVPARDHFQAATHAG
jgi:hypothetical protein